MADLGWPELSIIVIAFVLLFGWKKMPDMARSLGRSARIFKSEVDQLHTDGKTGPVADTAVSTAPTSPATDTTAPTPYAAGPVSLADAEARAAAAEAELASLRADAELARLRAERDAIHRTPGSH